MNICDTVYIYIIDDIGWFCRFSLEPILGGVQQRFFYFKHPNVFVRRCPCRARPWSIRSIQWGENVTDLRACRSGCQWWDWLRGCSASDWAIDWERPWVDEKWCSLSGFTQAGYDWLTVCHGKIHHAIKFGKPSISMGHLYHGELLVITRWYMFLIFLDIWMNSSKDTTWIDQSSRQPIKRGCWVTIAEADHSRSRNQDSKIGDGAT